MKINDVIHGFRITDIRDVEAQKSTAIVLEHEVTKAKAIKILNEDNNKAFGIGFRTPPKNSTGVAHILEHCVLSGSDKYRTKEPFMDLIQGSLQTFLNAMTFSDKTIYPIASRNDTDYHNLMDVYLDAVLHPLVLDKEEIFRQEGWTLNLHEELTYNGVVYNEMRGAMSAAEEQILEKVNEELLPDTIYRFNSGGDPYEIPALSYDEFKEFHASYYHPSNSIVYFYGDGDLEKELAHVQEFFSEYDYREVDSSIDAQEPFEVPHLAEFPYSVALSDDTESKDYLGICYGIGRSTVAEDVYMTKLMEEVLIDSAASPLKKALLDVGLGEDFLTPYNDGMHQVFGIIAKNTEKSRMEEFLTIVRDVFASIADEGVDTELLEASLNKLEFSLIEGPPSSAKGVIQYIQVLSSWLYDGDPLLTLDFTDSFAAFREKINQGALQNFIKERILSNPHCVEMIATPVPGLFDQKDAEVREALAAKLEALTGEEKDALQEQTKTLLDFQNAEDTPEAKATIPHLSLSDLSPTVDRIPQHEEEYHGATLLHNEVFTGRIVYLDIAFDLRHLTQSELAEVSHIASFLSDLDTNQRSYDQVSNAIYQSMGSLNIAPAVLEDIETGEPLPKLMVSAKFFSDKQADAMKILAEVLYQTKISDKKRIKEVLLEDRSTMEMSLIQSGHAVAMQRVLSYVSLAPSLQEEISGLDSYFALQELLANYDTLIDEKLAQWETLYRKLFTTEGLFIGVTTEKEVFDQLKDGWQSLLADLPDTLGPNQHYVRKERNKEAFLSAASVQYVSKGANLKALGYDYTGDMSVLTNLLSIAFLHLKIRAIGGAYGAGISISPKGLLATYSYRDPQLQQTIDVYDEMDAFLSELSLSQTELEDAIIGTINRFDPPMSARQKGAFAFNNRLTGNSYDRVESYLKDALATTDGKLRAHAQMLKDAMAQDYLCVLGNEEKIRESEDLFSNIIPLDYKARVKE